MPVSLEINTWKHNELALGDGDGRIETQNIGFVPPIFWRKELDNELHFNYRLLL
jgi:hypothetical protein